MITSQCGAIYNYHMLTKSPGGSFDVKDSIFASKNILTRKSDFPTTYSIAITSYLNLIYISAHPNSFINLLPSQVAQPTCSWKQASEAGNLSTYFPKMCIHESFRVWNPSRTFCHLVLTWHQSIIRVDSFSNTLDSEITSFGEAGNSCPKNE